MSWEAVQNRVINNQQAEIENLRAELAELRQKVKGLGFTGEGYMGETCGISPEKIVVISCRQCGAQHHVTETQYATGKYDPPAATWKEAPAELARLREESRWRDAAVELPEKDGKYFVVIKWQLSPGRDVETGIFLNGRFYSKYVTHWKPMPQLPEEK